VLCLVAGLAVTRFREIRLHWLRSVSHVLAKYSYGVYLTHMLAIWLGFQRLATLPRVAQWGVFAVTLVGLPLVLYHALEAPLTQFGARLAHRWYPARHLPPRELPELDETTPVSRAQLHALQLPASAPEQYGAGDRERREGNGHRPRHPLWAQAEMARQQPGQGDFPEPEAE